MKMLTILNTIAIVILFYFASESGMIDVEKLFNNQVEEELEVEETIEEEVAEEDETEEETEGEELEEEEEEGTLVLDDNLMPSGFVDLEGYLVTESVLMFGENVEQAFFAFSESSDEDVKRFIDELASAGNTVNRRSGSTYFLGLGCHTGSAIDNLNFNVTGANYTSLRKSNSTNLLTLRAFFNNEDTGGIGGACLSFAETVQVVEQV